MSQHSPNGSVALIGGRYELLEQIAVQNDAAIWEGYDSALGRRVHIWLLRQERADDPAAARRFWELARSAAASSSTVGHRVLDGGTDHETGRLFVVREWSPWRSERVGETQPIRLPPPGRRGEATSGVRPGRRMVLVGLLAAAVIGLLVVRSSMDRWLAWVDEPLGQASGSLLRSVRTPPGDGSQTATVPAAGSESTTVGTTPAATRASNAATSPPTATTRATASPGRASGVARRVVNTDGQGVALRAGPGGDRLPGKGYDEGVTVTTFETSGQWTHIRGPDGREGWVLSVTLAP